MFWSIEGNRSLIFPGNKLNNFEAKSTPEGLTVLTVSQAKRSDNGLVIICSAINLVGSISVRSKLTITSQEDRPPPIIIQGPVNQTLPVKSVALLNCRASGTPTPIISWYRDGIPVIPSNKINITESGLLTIVDLDKDTDQGLYTCGKSFVCRLGVGVNQINKNIVGFSLIIQLMTQFDCDFYKFVQLIW